MLIVIAVVALAAALVVAWHVDELRHVRRIRVAVAGCRRGRGAR